MDKAQKLIVCLCCLCFANTAIAETNEEPETENNPGPFIFDPPPVVSLEQDDTPPSVVLANALRLYQQEAYHEAAVQFERIASGQTPDGSTSRQRAQFFLGKCLFHLGFYQSSLVAFEEIVHAGPYHAYFRATLPWLGQLSQELPEPAGIIELVGLLGDSLQILQEFNTPDSQELYNELLYLMGRHWYRQNEFRAARLFLLQVSEGSRNYYPSLFFAGITHVRERQASPAVQMFRRIVGDLDERFFLSRQERRYRDLAWLSLARIYYSTRHWDSAITSWNRIPPTSEYWLDALFEQSWARFQADQVDRALGSIHTLTSPYFDESAYPEVLILQSVLYFDRCHHERSRQSIIRFQELYQPLRAELESISTQEEDMNLAFLRIAQRTHRDSDALSPAASRMLRSALSDRTLMRHLTYVEMLEQEEQRIESSPQAFRQSNLGMWMLQEVMTARSFAETNGGNLARHRYQRMLEELQRLENQGMAVLIELLRTERESLQGEPEATPERRADQVQGDSEHVVWPFEGEFWRDELGTYRQPIASICGR